MKNGGFLQARVDYVEDYNYMIQASMEGLG
jgi:hypothetical protein